MSEDDQCQFFHLIGMLACAGAGTLGSKHSNVARKSYGSCSLCDASSMVQSAKPKWEGKPGEEVFSTVLKLLQGNLLQASARPRIAAMLALRKLIMHTDNTAYLDLTQSYLGQWCLQSLRSSLRELRISAGFAGCPRRLLTYADEAV